MCKKGAEVNPDTEKRICETNIFNALYCKRGSGSLNYQ
jgi:hypothetical protein